MKALITGIKGFTGRYLAAELCAHGWEVWGLGAHPEPDDKRYRQVDLGDGPGLQSVVAELRPDVVIHLAAVAFVGHGEADAFYRVNLVGTRNLLAALAASGVQPRCVLLASSANVYGNATAGVLDETTPPDPANDYAVSKLAMEYMARLWMDKLPIVITRPFNYTGVGQAASFLLPKIVDHFRRKAGHIELGNIDVWRDFSDVRAVAEAYRKLLEARPAGAIVNVCSGQSYSIRDVITMAETITGQTMQVKSNPAFMRSHEVKSLCGDASRLRAFIGDWQPPPLKDTLEWMLRP